MNIVTRAGANAFAADAFGFFRDRALNSRGHFDDFDAAGQRIDLPKAPFSQEQFGATVGGPLVEEPGLRVRLVQRLVLDSANAVTIDDRTEVLHPFTATVLGTPQTSSATPGSRLKPATFPFRCDRRRHSGGSIRRSPTSPSPCGSTCRTAPMGIVTRSAASWRTAGRAVEQSRLRPGGIDVIAARPGSGERAASADCLPRPGGGIADPRCGGPCVGDDQGGPAVEISGVARAGRHNFTPQPRTTVRYQVLDSLSFAIGSHGLKTGGDFNFLDTRRAALPLNFGGQFVFIDLPQPLATSFGLPAPLSAIQAFALGLPVAVCTRSRRAVRRPDIPGCFRIRAGRVARPLSTVASARPAISEAILAERLVHRGRLSRLLRAAVRKPRSCATGWRRVGSGRRRPHEPVGGVRLVLRQPLQRAVHCIADRGRNPCEGCGRSGRRPLGHGNRLSTSCRRQCSRRFRASRFRSLRHSRRRTHTSR